MMFLLESDDPLHLFGGDDPMPDQPLFQGQMAFHTLLLVFDSIDDQE
jgi:hypothetical protein